jgi:hypothetical protein
MSSDAVNPSFSWAGMSTATKISAISSIVLLVSCFLSWAKVSAGPISASISGWSAYSLAKLVALGALVAIVLIVLEQVKPDLALPVPATLVLLGIGAVSLLIAVFRVIVQPDGGLGDAGIGFDVGPAFGVFVAAIAAGGLTYGAWRRMSEG